MLIHNPSLADEIYALNAIYGEGSMSATFSDANHTTVSVKLPGFNYSFLLRVFDDYPQSSPQVLGVDSLAESRKQEVQQNAVYLGACVPAVHYPGTVCLYDAIEEFNTVHKALQAHIQQPGDTEEDSQRKSAQRAAILRRLAVRAKNMFKTRQELKCCGQSVPLKTLREVGGLDAELLDALGLWLQELHTANPIYCPWEDCLAYIPGASGMGDYAKCHVCKKRMCMASRGKEHGGICKRDKKLQALVRKEKWKFCPWSGQEANRTAIVASSNDWID
ncbi:hypothetical protein AYO22_00860 [Fonsecaea multimorphosa]|nr:hypothetical protein AYO22_00860 [Fonsecaea multimorphosa]